jgi:hypothetical protein
LRTGSYQKRAVENNNVSHQAPAKHRMTLRELEMTMPEENSSLDGDEDKEGYFDKLMQEDQKHKKT